MQNVFNQFRKNRYIRFKELILAEYHYNLSGEYKVFKQLYSAFENLYALLVDSKYLVITKLQT